MSSVSGKIFLSSVVKLRRIGDSLNTQTIQKSLLFYLYFFFKKKILYKIKYFNLGCIWADKTKDSNWNFFLIVPSKTSYKITIQSVEEDNNSLPFFDQLI